MKGLWFKAKTYGYGWYPCSWQGWVVTAIYFLILLFAFRLVDITSQSISDTLIEMIFPFVILTFLFILICIKTGEKSKWRWGTNKHNP